MRTKFHSLFLISCLVFLCGASKITISDIETAIIKEDYRQAETLAESFIDTKPKKDRLDQALYYLGVSQLRQGRNEQSRYTFNLLLSSFPKKQLRDKTYLGIIDSFYLDGKFKSGLNYAEELHKKSRNSEFLSLIYYKLARGNLKLAKWEKAKVYLERIISKFPDSFEAHLAKQLLEERQYFTVQVGAFLERWRAEKLIQELKQRGEYAYMIEAMDRNKRKFYRVRVGQFDTLDAAHELKVKLTKLGYPTRIYP